MRARTLLDTVRAASDSGGGITFIGGIEGDRFTPYAELIELASRVSAGLQTRNIKLGGRVLLVLPTGAPFVASFVGCILAGVVPCATNLPSTFRDPTAFQQRLRTAAHVVHANAAIVDEELRDLARDCLDPSIGVWSARELLGTRDTADCRAPHSPEAVAFVQFTSGTTSQPRGVKVSHRAALANLRQIAEAAEIDDASVIASWLPMFHDMGLVGGLLTGLHTRADLLLSRPIRFLRDPRWWFETITTHRVSHSPAPTFAYSYSLARLKNADLSSLDLTSWRAAWIGAEPIPAELLRAFEERFRPRGFGSATFLPCYGLAEATLAVSFTPVREPYRTLTVAREELFSRGQVTPPANPQSAMILVSAGQQLKGTTVTVRGPTGAVLPDGLVGEIAVTGPNVFSGYFDGCASDEPGDGVPTSTEDYLRTGDLGFLWDGELFVTGRLKDVLILRGQNYHPSEIEWAAEHVAGLRTGKVVAFGVSIDDTATESLCLMVEPEREGLRQPDELITELRRCINEETGLVVRNVVVVKSGTIPFTSSGKLQRARAREIFLAMKGAGAHEIEAPW